MTGGLITIGPRDRPKIATRSIVIHASESWYADLSDGRFDFFNKLIGHATGRDVQVFLTKAQTSTSDQLLMARHVHILIGPRKPQGPLILHAHPGYIWGFWYLDTAGANYASSLRHSDYEPALVDPEKARWFFDGVTGYHVRENVSKFPQAPRADSPLDKASAVIFLQEIENFKNPLHHLTTEQMIVTTAGHKYPQRVYVKPHPKAHQSTLDLLTTLASRHPNIAISDASVHDLIAASDCIICQNSAAGFEALMQSKPVITCAITDYCHATLPAISEHSLRQQIDHAQIHATTFDYPRYLYWFLGTQLLEPAQDDFENRLWSRISPMLDRAASAP